MQPVANRPKIEMGGPMRYLHKLLIVSTCCAVVTLALVSESTSFASVKARSTMKGLTLAFVERASNNPVFAAMAGGSKIAATQLGGKLITEGPTAPTPTSQIPFIQTLTLKHVAGIFISSNDMSANDTALKAAARAGTTVVTMDSDTDASARRVFVSDGTTQAIGIVSLKMLCSELPKCSGQVAIISGAANSPNQNAWVAVMVNAIKHDPQYRGIKLVKIAYGNDVPQTATTVAEGVLQQFPHLAGLMMPSSVAMVAVAQVLEQTHKAGKIMMTGLALPSQMIHYIQDKTVKQFSIWNMSNLGYLAYWVTYELHVGKLTGAVGESFVAGTLGRRVIGPGGVISVGNPAIISAANISHFHF